MSYPTGLRALIEEAIFAPLYIFASFVKNKVLIGVWVYLWAFFLVPLDKRLTNFKTLSAHEVGVKEERLSAAR